MGEKLGLVGLETTSIGKLLKTANYNLIVSQRDYSWTEDEVEDFWLDITKSDDEHFFGLIFFIRFNKSNDVAIVEGQQRLATATIFISVCRDVLYELNKNDKLVTVLDSDFIREFDYLTQIQKPKLHLSEMDREFFREIVQKLDTYENKKQQYNLRPNKKASHELIWGCYEYFYKSVKKEIDKLSQREKSEKIVNLVNRLANDFYTIITTTQNEGAVYKIFGTINARGIELTNANLLKNYLFSKSKVYLEDVKKNWAEIQNLLDENLNDFLRYYWIANHRFVRDSELYDELTNQINTPEKVYEFVTNLKKDSEYFNQIINPNPQQYNGNQNVVNSLKEITDTLKAKQVLPLLLLARKKFSVTDFETILRACIIFTFRYSTICNFHNNKLEKLYYGNIATKLRNGTIKTTSEFITELKKSLYPIDTIFINKFKDRPIKSPKISRYILHRINYELQTVKEQRGDDDLTLEHIIPQNPDNNWETYLKSIGIDVKDEEKMQSLIYRIGNLTLLAEESNQKADNNIFHKKRDEVYKKSELPINKKLVFGGQTLENISDWDENSISYRGEELGKKAAEIWNL